MNSIHRRDFLKLGGIAAVIGLVEGNASPQIQSDKDKIAILQKAVKFTKDGIDMTPLEYSHLLLKLAEEGKIKTDYYSTGGTVEELEHKFAKWLGKESAVFMPTGTLANHIAIRKLAGTKKRAIVQEESHIYNDSGDCLQTLSGINLIPMAFQKATMTLDEVKAALSRTAAGRVATGVGVISIESPVRRKYEEMFDFEEMKKISAFAREKGIKLHMDGARLFVASVHSGIPPSEYAGLFDTVYTSLYKCFNAAAGAILAGPKNFIEDLFHVRRAFGGGMPQVWPFAAVALHYIDSFIDEYSKALNIAGKIFKLLQKNDAFKIEKIPNGTNVFKLHVRGTELQIFKNSLKQKNIHLPSPQKNWNGFTMKINPTLNRTTAESLADVFNEAL